MYVQCTPIREIFFKKFQALFFRHFVRIFTLTPSISLLKIIHFYLYYFICSNEHTKLKIKVLMCKTLLKPLWTHGLPLWGTAKVSNTNKFQQLQNIALRKIINDPPIIFNHSLHKKTYQ